jgi:hypothetical protein
MKSDVPIRDRPGAQLDHRFSEPVHAVRAGKEIHLGYYDPTNAVYQWGGDLSTQVYWKRRVLALGPEECEAIKRLQPDRLEFIDKGTICYSISTAQARQVGYWYDGEGGVGRRLGIPLADFARSSA